jgi:RHS repeat-associated protein
MAGQEAEEFVVGNPNGATPRYYNALRWYRTSIGRYTQADPLDYGGGAYSQYAFANNNALNFSDPLGASCGGLPQWASAIALSAALGALVGLAAAAAPEIGIAALGELALTLTIAIGEVALAAIGAGIDALVDGLALGALGEGEAAAGAAADTVAAMGGDGAAADTAGVASEGLASSAEAGSSVGEDSGIAEEAAGDLASPAGEEPTTTLYRMVSHGEYQDIVETGVFRPGPNGGYETGKWFAESGEDAATWGDRMEGQGNFRIVQAEFPDSVAGQFFRNPRLDGIGPARFGTYDQIGQPPITLWPGSP